jgi:ABC-type sugar transport system ATPase subunit
MNWEIAWTVLRDGKENDTSNISDVTPEELVDNDVGEKAGGKSQAMPCAREYGFTRSRASTVLNREEGINLNLHAGEILGVTGLVGGRKTEMARSLCG